MDIKEKIYFDNLHKDRSDSANTFEKPSNREMWRSIVEKYSDQAHFIYELIQNADDAGATRVRFVLKKDQLLFFHNGNRHFSISNPETEDIDSKQGCLGDINAITGIAFSNKKNQENKIGKFGVGFKAVFQYTSTPYIYDPKFCFKIDRYIVPTLLENDHPDRSKDETLFVFPFNHVDRDSKDTFRDIKNKLVSLSYPILFLSNLLEISYEIDKCIGIYEKETILKYTKDNTICEKICLNQFIDNEKKSQNIWLFSRKYNNLNYSVGFLTDENNRLIPASDPAFCYFPTKENTGLKFLIHAPFLLTDSREGIRAGIKHNINLIHVLSKLASDSLLYLKEIGEKLGVRLIQDNIVEIIPYNEDDFCDLDNTSRISFKPFYSSIKEMFQKEKIIPTINDYVDSRNAYWASVPYLTRLFNDDQLKEISRNGNSKWVFCSLGRDEIQRNNKSLFSYINSIIFTNLSEDSLIAGRSRGIFNNTIEIKGITGTFIEKQKVEWLHKFYKWISETSHRTELIKEIPIFLDQDSKAAAAFDKHENHILFLPVKNIQGYKTIREDFLNNEDTLKFIKKLGITEPSLRDQIYNVILPMYEKNGEIDTYSHFALLFKYYLQCPREDSWNYIHQLKRCDFLTYYSESTAYRGKASDLYLPTTELIKYFETKPKTKFIALEEYKKMVGEDEEEKLLSFFEDLGINMLPVSVRVSMCGYYDSSGTNEFTIDGLSEILMEISQTDDRDLSIFLWEMLCKLETNEILDSSVLKKENCYRPDRRYNWRSYYEDSEISNLLCSTPWIMDNSNNFVAPKDIRISQVSSNYSIDLEGATDLIKDLKIQEDYIVEEEETYNLLSEKQKQQIDVGKLCEEYGLTIDDLTELYRKKQRTVSEANEEYVQKILDDSKEVKIDETSEEIDDISEDSQISRKKVVNDIVNRTKNIHTINNQIEDVEEVDFDEYIPTAVDFSRKAELEKQKAAREIDKIAHQEYLQNQALDSEKYSFKWFKALLKLEIMNSNYNNSNSKEISISFTKVEREEGTKRTLILKQPNQSIPQFMEDLADIPLVIYFGNEKKNFGNRSS